MKRRILSIMTALALCLGLCPAPALAAGTPTRTERLVLYEMEETTESTEEGWKWEPDINTLTLKNCYIKSDNVLIIVFPDSDEAHLVLEGTNIIETGSTSYNYIIATSQSGQGKLKVSGSGSLTVAATAAGLSNPPYIFNGSTLTIEDGATIHANIDLCTINQNFTMNGGSVVLAGEYVKYGIYVNAGDVIINDGNLKIDAGVTGMYLPGIPPTTRTNNVKISGGTVNINAPVSAIHIKHLENNADGTEQIEIIGGEVNLTANGRAFQGETITVGENAKLNVQVKGGDGLSVIEGRNVTLAAGTYTGSTNTFNITAADTTLADLLSPGYAIFNEADGTGVDRTKTSTGPGTFTVKECTHEGIKFTKNEDGSHSLDCPYCGYGYEHPTAYTATASGGVITVGEGCEEDESCGYEAPLGSLTVSIPELAYGELDKEISVDPSKLTNWTGVGLQVDRYDLIPVMMNTSGYPPIVTVTIGKLTNNGLLTAGEHTLTVTIGISVPGGDPDIVHTASCEIPFTVDPAELKPDYVVATNREYEKGNRAVALVGAAKEEPDSVIEVDFPDNTIGTVSGENAGYYKEVTLTQDVTSSDGNYIIPAGTYPVRGRIGNTEPSADGVMIIQAFYEGLREINTSAKAGTTGTYDFTNLLQGIDGAVLGETHISSNSAIFDGEPTVSGNILTYKLKADAAVGGKGGINVLMRSTNYVTTWLYVTVTVTDKDVPALTVSPITVTYTGEAVPASAIQGAAKVGNTAVPGTWAFAEGQALINVADSGVKAVKFTPEDEGNYAAVEGTVMVTINKATPAGAPTYTAISASGKTLADAGLTAPEGWPEGVLTWEKDDTTEVTANTAYKWTFTPSDTDNYNTLTGSITPWRRSTGGGGGGTSQTTPPVSTGTTTEGGTPTTETTAVPPASVSGGTATATVDTSTGSEIVKQAVANDSETVVIAPKITGDVSKTEVSIPASTVGQIGSQTGASLTVSTPVADVTIPNGGLGSLGSAGGTVTVTAEQTGNTVELTVTAGGRAMESVPGGVTLTVPAEDAAPGTVAVLIREDGTREVVRKSVAGDGRVTIPLDGSAKLEIVDNSKRFTDVPATGWVAEAAAFVSSHEMFQGTAPGKFSPDAPMSRGMLAVVLHNLENNPAQTMTGAFADVSSGQWYAEGVAWAEAQGIIGGYGDGRFGPNDSVTREQLAVMLWRYAGSPAATEKELNFADADRASDWAVEALRWATEKGILDGKGGGILDPAGQATRAETAQMLKKFMEKR